MGKLLAKVVKKLVNPVKIVTWVFRSAADGTWGPQAKAAYWFLAGKKGWIIAGITALAAFLVELQASPSDCAAISCSAVLKFVQEWGPVILAALGASALDDALRSDPPTRD